MRLGLRVVCDAFPGLDPRTCAPLVLEPRPWKPTEEVASLQDADVGLMPLPENAWTRAKCGFKLFQCMVSVLSPVASPVGVTGYAGF